MNAWMSLFNRTLQLLLAVTLVVYGVNFRTAHAQVKPTSKPYIESHVGELKRYFTAYEDTLVRLARDYNLGFVELRAANPGVDPWMPGEGVRLSIPTMHLLPDAPREGIVINLAEMRLYAFIEPGEPPITHPLGVGRVGLSTPLGATTVVRTNGSRK